MKAAKLHGLDDIVADCGGTLSCASCHVYVEPGCLGRLPAPSDDEEQMLDFVAAGRTPQSRLSCQLVVAEDMQGLTVRIAHPQL
ncbi:MAG: 2Fe-2S iron-sulfur cluster-binding protein [Hyphomicrobiales bacterium]|nr:2Fe-2S iron-sulfur cluster-binding protein [Hyphomicrobiales bacterium]